METKTASVYRVATPGQRGDRRGPSAFDIVPRYWQREDGGSQDKLTLARGAVSKEANRIYDARIRGLVTDEDVLSLSSKAFRRSRRFPKRYTVDGDNFNPPIDISGIPEGTESLALLMERRDAASKQAQVHWLVWNIPVIGHIRENDVPGCQGINDFGTTFYHGPRPETRPQEYTFHVFALDSLIYLPVGARKYAFLEAIEDHILAYGELTGIC